MLTDRHWIAMGRLTAAQTFLARNVAGVAEELTSGSEDFGEAMREHGTIEARARYCAHMLAERDDRDLAPCAADLIRALSRIAESRMPDFWTPELQFSAEQWIADQADPWAAFDLKTDAEELEQAAILLFDYSTDLLSSLGAWMDERDAAAPAQEPNTDET